MQAWLTNNNNNNAGRSRSLFSSATLREEAGSGRHGFRGGVQDQPIGDPRTAMVVPSCRSAETGVSTPSHNRRRDHRIRPTKRQYRGLGQ